MNIYHHLKLVEEIKNDPPPAKEQSSSSAFSGWGYNFSGQFGEFAATASTATVSLSQLEYTIINCQMEGACEIEVFPLEPLTFHEKATERFQKQVARKAQKAARVAKKVVKNFQCRKKRRNQVRFKQRQR